MTASKEHRVVLRLGSEGVLYWSVRCPFDAGDPTRPCWPRHEDGRIYAPPQPYCNWTEWLDAIGPECWGASDLGEFVLLCDWTQYDGPTFTAGERR